MSTAVDAGGFLVPVAEVLSPLVSLLGVLGVFYLYVRVSGAQKAQEPRLLLLAFAVVVIAYAAISAGLNESVSVSVDLGLPLSQQQPAAP